MWRGTYLVVGVVVACLVALALIRRFVRQERVKEANDFVAFSMTVVGTIYAVILAFMVFAVWTDYQVAQDMIEREANALIRFSRFAYNTPGDLPQKFGADILGYAHAVIDDEWPAMSRLKESAVARERLDNLFARTDDFEVKTLREQALLSQGLDALNLVSSSRRSRLNKAKDELPDILWDLLIFGAVATIGGAAFFGVGSFAQHALNTAVMAATITFVLFAINEINHPFRGMIHVEPTALQESIRVIERLQKTEMGAAAAGGATPDDPDEERPPAPGVHPR